MHAAQITKWNDAPKYIEIPNPRPSNDGSGKHIKVEFVGIHQLVRGRATGQHYTSGSLPHIPGVDGVGTTSDGQAVYFTILAIVGAGSLADEVILDPKWVVPLPPNADKLSVATLMNPALASFMGLKTRVHDIPKDFTLLITGVTGLSGTVAVGIARLLGAKHIIGLGRDADKLAAMADLDAFVTFAPETSKQDAELLANTPTDVVLDFLWGSTASTVLQHLKPGPRGVQWVEVGALSGNEVPISANLVRSKNITFCGSGPGSWTMDEYAELLQGMVDAVSKLPKWDKVKVRKLQDIEQVWNEKGPERLVIEI